MERFVIGSFAWPMLAATAASVLCACGDVDAFKLNPDSWGETQPLVDWNGTIVELHHETLPCNAVAPACLRSFVGDHMEFGGLEVKGLKSECSPGVEAAVAIDVQARSIVFDFSNVEGPGAFRRAEFDGFVVKDLAGAAPQILEATLDREASTLDLEDRDVIIDRGMIRANFAGLSFGDKDLVKVDLVFAD